MDVFVVNHRAVDQAVSIFLSMKQVKSNCNCIVSSTVSKLLNEKRAVILAGFISYKFSLICESLVYFSLPHSVEQEVIDETLIAAIKASRLNKQSECQFTIMSEASFFSPTGEPAAPT